MLHNTTWPNSLQFFLFITENCEKHYFAANSNKTRLNPPLPKDLELGLRSKNFFTLGSVMVWTFHQHDIKFKAGSVYFVWLLLLFALKFTPKPQIPMYACYAKISTFQSLAYSYQSHYWFHLCIKIFSEVLEKCFKLQADSLTWNDFSTSTDKTVRVEKRNNHIYVDIKLGLYISS